MYFLLNFPVPIAETAAVISDEAKTFFAEEIAAFINGPANLLIMILKIVLIELF